jgi:putative methionine-R-sulfoxide reductase with GAF domain
VTSDDAVDGGGLLRGVQAMSDAALVHLDVEDLVQALLERIRDQLRVDTATVLLLDQYGQELVATASLGLEEEVTQGLRLPVGLGFAGKVASTRAPVQLDNVDRSRVLNPLLIERGVRSVLGVPMIAAGHLLGVLHVGTLQPRHFTEDEVKLLQLAAERVALATQTRLTQLDRATTVALQRSLLPARHITIPGLEVAARYVPGAREGVGGDWYDVFALPSGHVGVVIGDVAGHGLRAAVVMGRIRSALRAYALESDDPADVLCRLDRKISIFEPGAMATALYAVIAPDLASMTVSVAGHPPLVYAIPGEQPRVLNIEPDLPLGVRPESPRRKTTAPLSPGQVILLYTDGLIERRGTPLTDSLELLRGVVVAGPAETVCVRVMSAMIGGEAAVDDVAVLAISRTAAG